jgi:hypothetical protein
MEKEIIDLGKYLIMVGIRSLEFTYSDQELFTNIKYFDKCRKECLSAYKALLFLHEMTQEQRTKFYINKACTEPKNGDLCDFSDGTFIYEDNMWNIYNE